MLRSLKSIIGYKLLANDGEIGSCKDFLFEDDSLSVRYLEANSGGWLLGRLVLLSTVAIEKIKEEENQISVSMSKNEIKDSPALASHEPVSVQYEKALHTYFGWSYYWSSMGAPLNSSIRILEDPVETASNVEKIKENHLRSFNEVSVNYKIEFADGKTGCFEDFIVDVKNWNIVYMVIDTRNFFSGKKVLLSPHWIKNISWDDEVIVMDMTYEQVKSSPEYEPDKIINRKYEVNLYDYYGRPKYWEEDQ